ncbi:filamentous hemagglutinin family protein, partial [bacterium]|nr:filamentous hemagglutinin family protein [bacterium]
ATGGQLLVSSGRYYREGESRTGADINLVVRQSGDVVLNPGAAMGVGLALSDSTGASYGGAGTFALDRFSEGSFASLSLGGKYFANATPIPYGGNVGFQGKIDLQVKGGLRLAAGGVIQADQAVNIHASYLAVGQDFRPPQNPNDVFLPFQQDPANPTTAYSFAPTSGSGNVTFNAGLIDVGTLSLQNIGQAGFNAGSGDIRGNGTLSVAGAITLDASKIYPTSLGSFSIFAYDSVAGSSSVTIRTSGGNEIPLSAGGNLSIYASNILQSGVLRAPLGTITLGWDGTDTDPADADLDSPYNAIAAGTIAAPITRQLTLAAGSVTSVSAAPAEGSPKWLAPFGVSPDGQTWIDPRGVNVTLSGLPEKSVSVAGESVSMESGAVVDIRGGGDLFASRWVAGNGGSIDLLGSASAAWGGGTEYQAGDLVTFGGETWSARVRHTGRTPSVNLYWSKVAQSFAIIPSSSLAVAPYTPFNTGMNSGLLAGDPGYVNPGLGVGDTITLEAGNGLSAGSYTLLPRRYALLPGAFVVTPLTGTATGTITLADGSQQVSGYLSNRYRAPETTPDTRTRFEIASAAVVQKRASYETYSANTFLTAIAGKLEITHPQQLPGDAGSAAFHGNSALRLDGLLRTQASGQGARVDISSFADIRLAGANPGGGGVVLSTSTLTAWGADSLLIGGIRRQGSDGKIRVDVRTGHLTLDNSGSELSAADVVLASKESLTVSEGSSLSATGGSSDESDLLWVAGDGALLRVSTDGAASIARTGVAGLTSALLQIGGGVKLRGESLILDSTYGSDLAASLELGANHLTLGSGQISVLFEDASGSLLGSTVSPHLTLKGATLDKVPQAQDLTLRSYRSIDFYGSGIFGSDSLKNLTLSGSSLRGYEQAAESVTIRASQVTFENSGNAVLPAAPAVVSGRLQVDADTIQMGANQFSVSGYQNLSVHASSVLRAVGSGSFTTAGDFHALTPVITGDAGASYSIRAAGAMVLNRSAGVIPLTNALGASLTLEGSRISANTSILLPSGQLTLRATGGDIAVGGDLSVAGSSKTFNDLTRFASAGSITLESLTGDVILTSGASVAVSAAAGGGNAGMFKVSAAQGLFSSAASVVGHASAGYTAGSFSLDTESLATGGSASLAALNAGLDGGGFNNSRSFRIRNGDVTIDSVIRSHAFSLATDRGSIRVTGEIDASGATGGSIVLAAHNHLTLAPGSRLSAAAVDFDSAGKGGSVLLEAGTQSNGVANFSALLDLQAGSTIDLSVQSFVPGSYNTPGSSAFQGQFAGTLHLRAPRTDANADLRIAPIQSTIHGASSVVAEGFKVYSPADGVLDIAQRNLINTDAIEFLGAAGVGNANELAMRGKLLSGASSLLDSLLVIAPGAEIINSTGDLTLGLANHTTSDVTNPEALAAADWDLSKFRYGSRSAPGVLTLRATGDLIFNNTLSDGFNPIAQGTAQTFADNGHSLMWLGTLMNISESLPINTQSWSYRLAAGADTDSSNYRAVLTLAELDAVQPGKGSVLVGEFYPAIPNAQENGAAAAIGSAGQTADSIRISITTNNRGNRFEVIRSGTGDIAISAGRDVQLRNLFSTIYTAGVALPTATTVFSANDFVLPVIPTSVNRHPSQSGGGLDLGAVQQIYQPKWAMAGGNIELSAQSNIGRYTLVDEQITLDSSRQMPGNWLYRRGYVDPETGLFANDGGFGTNSNPNFQNADNLTDVATSTAWWIDYSNFFQGIGTLGGGNINLAAGGDIVNVDAVAPTNARMPGRRKNPDFGSVPNAPEFLNLAPDAEQLLEFGGGDVRVVAGRNIDGGVYYAEKGEGTLHAGGAITTNAARSPSLGLLDGSVALDPLTWMPTTLFVGKSHFEVTAFGDILLGPVANPFLLPQGLNNKFWYKTSFSTFSPDAGVTAASYGGSVSHRMEINLPDGASGRSILDVWYSQQNLFNGIGSSFNASNFQPWLRLNEVDLQTYNSVFSLQAPNLRSTAFNGDLNLIGSWTQAPSAQGNLELTASGSIIGLQKIGMGLENNRPIQVWTSSTINVSDASMTSIPGVAAPLAYQSVVGRDRVQAVQSVVDILQSVNLALSETGSYRGFAGTTLVKQSLHGSGLLHAADSNPVRLYAAGGDVSGLTLFSPKVTRILAERDITDVAFYLQNLAAGDITLVSAGRDIIPFNENAPVRALAGDVASGNFVGDAPLSTSSGGASSGMAGDIQINGPGVLQVLSGRNLDLGTGANFTDGTGVGITSIGNFRNPNLPFAGADIIALAGVTAADGQGAADGLSLSSLNFDAFIEKYLKQPETFDSSYWDEIGGNRGFGELTEEQQAMIGLEKFYVLLRDAGRKVVESGNYDGGYDAVKSLFGSGKPVGEISTRAREIRTSTGGSISLGVPGGGIKMASDIFGNPLTPPGIVTEYGGSISTFTEGNVDIGQARIFTLRGGDIIMWSSNGNIAAGTSARTVVTAPPTRVVIDITSANIQTDLGGLATGGGIGVLAAVADVKPGNVDLIAPRGSVDAGDAGIRVTGNLNIAAQTVLNAGNISAGGKSTGTSASSVSAPSVASVTSASNSSAAANSTMAKTEAGQSADDVKAAEDPLSIISVEVIGYGEGEAADDEEEDKSR